MDLAGNLPGPIEQAIIESISRQVVRGNLDNISRTNAYFAFYQQHPNIKWSFLASMVSRNAGWNMCDLMGPWFTLVLSEETRNRLFMTYERANWLIFQDAFPQLLVYHYSVQYQRPLFHLLKSFSVSEFMVREWYRYWQRGDNRRLIYALIINEQNVIEKPIMKHPLYQKKVFHSLLFQFEDLLHFSAVLFPTMSGMLFGASVNGFRSVSKRINLGKRLVDILFHPTIYPDVLRFAQKTDHTGSRNDYEQYSQHLRSFCPMLRTSYPIIPHHLRPQEDWSSRTSLRRKWFEAVEHRHPWKLTEWFSQKQRQMRRGIIFISLVSQKKL